MQKPDCEGAGLSRNPRLANSLTLGASPQRLAILLYELFINRLLHPYAGGFNLKAGVPEAPAKCERQADQHSRKS
jgi:hypothetical protein